MASPTGGITLAGVASLNGGRRPMAFALGFAHRQFSEFAGLLSAEMEHLPGQIDLEFRGSSASRPGEWIERSMLLSASLLLPAAAGVVTHVDLEMGH